MADASTPSAVAVITGGASGFGLALAHRCAARAMAVVLIDRDGGRAAQEARSIPDQHGVDRLTDEEWRWVLDVNVVGSARVARAFVPLLRRAPERHLAFTTSSSVLDPASRLGVYQASKFAVWGLAETLRLELAEDEIGVSVIFPSGMTSRHLESSEAAQPDHVRRPIADAEDFSAMTASNPGLSQALATPEDASLRVLDAILAGDRYIVTHGDLVDPLERRHADLRRAAEAAR